VCAEVFYGCVDTEVRRIGDYTTAKIKGGVVKTANRVSAGGCTTNCLICPNYVFHIIKGLLGNLWEKNGIVIREFAEQIRLIFLNNFLGLFM
jgi:hypothetical protein